MAALTGFLSPSQQLQELRKEAVQQRLAPLDVAQQAFATAPTLSGRLGALGQSIGAGLGGLAFSPTEEELKERPEVKMAENRQKLLQLDPEDKKGVLAGYQKAVEQGDFQAAQFALERLDRINQLALQREILKTKKQAADANASKPKKRKPWSKDLRDGFKAQVRGLDWVKDINSDDEEQQVAESVVSAAESLWQKMREEGKDIKDTSAISTIAGTAKKSFKKSFFGDTFDFDEFQTSLNALGVTPPSPSGFKVVGRK
jgi:hypothetical protein